MIYVPPLSSGYTGSDVSSALLEVTGVDLSSGSITHQRNSASSKRYNAANRDTDLFQGAYEQNARLMVVGRGADRSLRFIRYYVNDQNNLVRQVQDNPDGAIVEKIVAAGITGLSFQYLKQDETPVALPAGFNDLRKIRVVLTARTEKPDPRDGRYRTMEMSTLVYLRNLAMRGAGL
jgi:hypothetical protein